MYFKEPSVSSSQALALFHTLTAEQKRRAHKRHYNGVCKCYLPAGGVRPNGSKENYGFKSCLIGCLPVHGWTVP